MPRRFSRRRKGSLSKALSAMMRSGQRRGRPRGRGTLTWASVASANVTSCGDADAKRTPKGIPLPSARTIHFVPLPRLVFPTAKPLFLPRQNCRLRRSLPSAAGLVDPVVTVRCAIFLPAPLALPNPVNGASRSIRWDTAAADRATVLPYVTPTRHLRSMPYCWPRAVHDHHDGA